MDVITAEERRLIEAAIATKGITRCEPGKSAFEQVWCPDTKRIVYKNDVKSNFNGSGKSQKKTKKLSPRHVEVAQRRDRVRKANEQGLTVRGIMQKLSLSDQAVRDDLKNMGLKCNRLQLISKRKPRKPKSKATRSKTNDVTEKRKRIVRLIKAGKSLRDVCEIMGMHVEMATTQFRRLGLSLAAFNEEKGG
ncbi:hypothetical protein ACFFUT_12420 [Pseudohalocynthiibacter aestuariivivens]|uniref:Helix-turn-helix domain-containing protein n=1 Tax=Pseudohalocynthiibacter aestuariivivens TaxID=1591409 RepID=A0ABV5JIA7_9RHOB|nr:hypothetical protein [Pseudohalocynthiibacter aestuariivivens]MBS9718973.1 hypothetical protein [Pseudohalocynthiibacter aestuariivivens]